MAITCVWGLPRAGKGLMGAHLGEEYALKGRRVVANYPLYITELASSPKSKLADVRIQVLPSCPTSQQLYDLGVGGEEIGKNGLLILDEAVTFLGSREWNNKDRPRLLEFLRLHGKRRWDILLIVQDPNSLDKQVLALVSRFGRVRNWADLPIPVVGNFFGLMFPKFHSCVFKMGREPMAPKIGSTLFKGVRYYSIYDTEWDFHEHENDGEYVLLDAHRTKFYVPPKFSEPKHPLVELLARLPEAERLKHWKRLEALGAFSRSFTPRYSCAPV